MIKFGIIGCGYIAQRHAQWIIKNSEAKLISVFDIDTNKAKRFATDHSVFSTANIDDLLQNTKIDIISICTPNGLHANHTILALNSKKHVLVEKPMCLSSADSESMIKAAQKNNKSLFVVKQNRFNPPVKRVKTLIENNELGKVFLVQVNGFWNRNNDYYSSSNWKGKKDLDGGILFTQFSHFIDILYYLFGDVLEVKGFSNNYNHQSNMEFEDSACFSFIMENGIIGTLAATVNSYKSNMEGSIVIFSENATIKIGGKYLNTIEYISSDKIKVDDLETSRPANNYGHYEGSMSNHDKVINNVVNALKGREPIMTNGEDGKKVVQIIEKLYRSVDE